MANNSRKTHKKLSIQNQVIYGALRSLTREVGSKLKRASFSSIIRESDDYGVALVSSDHTLIAEAETTPLQMGPLANYCRGVCNVLAQNRTAINSRGIYLHNDPYQGASHSPDIAAIAPIFLDDELFAFIGTAAHHLDIGAAVPGTCIVEAHDAFSEGIRLLAYPVELSGKYLINNWQFLHDNVRMPEIVIGDLKAQVAACHFGKNRFYEIVKRYGKHNLKNAINTLMEVTAERMCERIREIPNGVYHAEGFLDGYTDRNQANIKIAVTLKVHDATISVDLTGSAPQLDHAPINMPFYGTTDMAILLTLRTLLLPESEYPDLPHNSGLYQPITIYAPKGTIVNPNFPAPTIGRFCGGQMLANLIVKALAPVLPRTVCAGCSSTKAITFSGLKKSGKPWVYMDITEGAYGGSFGQDGLDAVDILYANTKNNPIEDIENHYPLRVERYELREKSAGAGKWRGGFGPIRETRLLEDGFVSIEGDGFLHPAWGINGGKPGKTSGVQLIMPNTKTKAKTKAKILPSKLNNLHVKSKTVVRDLCPAGGGYGNPKFRDKKLILKDHEDGLV
ncbi:MAG: hydantoinase B/oxoprolinase family protein [Gammaproteobacteria bacterium]|nr:hydantoinase B/oxoprolinase family protein [Gammaproteobacteria bacterium]